jgi:hypothetical protein
LRKAADDELREQARKTLSDALAGKDVPRPALDAAKSLFAYRAAGPPAPERSQQSQGLAKVVTLGDLLDAAFESHGLLELHGELRCGDKTWTRP